MADPNVLELVQKEIKGFGDNMKALKDSIDKDLSDVRKIADEAKNSTALTELKTKIDAFSVSVTEKHAAFEAGVKGIEKAWTERADDIEAKLNRIGLAGPGQTPDELKLLHDWNRERLQIRQELKAGVEYDPTKHDVAELKAYGSTFATYLRRGEQQLSMDGHKAMQVGSDPDGGYFVTPTVSSRILTIIFETSPLRSLATVDSISTDAIEYPVDDGEFNAGWVGEVEARPETATSQVGVQRIPVHEIYAAPRATQKLLEDAGINVENWISRKIGDKIGRVEAAAFINGDGVKKPRGILTYPNGTARGFIEQIKSGNATGIPDADALIRMIYGLKEPYAARAAWLMRRASIASIMLLKDGNGQYLWRPGIEQARPSTLLGYPVREAADMPAVGSGALPIAFGDFSRGYTIVDRLGLSTLRDPFTAKPFVIFYTRKRVGGDVTNFEAIKLMVIST